MDQNTAMEVGELQKSPDVPSWFTNVLTSSIHQLDQALEPKGRLVPVVWNHLCVLKGVVRRKGGVILGSLSLSSATAVGSLPVRCTGYYHFLWNRISGLEGLREGR